MIFSSEMAKLILAGRKSQTRRVVKDSELQCRYVPGRSYALQGKRWKADQPRITVLEVRPEQLGQISLRDVRREGFRTTEEFKAYWVKLHKRFDSEQLVWVISFVLGDQTDTPRLLAARPGAPHGDYVQNPVRALVGTAEEVSAPIQARYSREASERLSEAARRRRRLASVLAELATLAPTPQQKKRLRSIEHQIKALGKEEQAAA